MESRNLYADTLKIAAETLGGSRILARRLGVPPDELELWMSGRKAAPLEPFLTALEIIEV
jgi:DNA-binding transcriptional regulator YdaS (Cro superfamily)